ncbi:MAG: DMT family transporter [Paracoccaceae bacterium]
MTFGVFLAVLGAAFLHASWNGLIRTGNPGGSRLQNLLVMALVQGAIGVVLLGLAPWPSRAVWPWLIAAAALHTGYKLCLSAAYDHGDLSRVYPLARGSAPLMVLVASAVVGADVLSTGQVMAVLVLVAGILTMAGGAIRAGESRRLIPWALATAAMTTGYTLVDGLGARIAGDLILFLGWTFALDGLFFGLTVAAWRGPAIFAFDRRGWGRGALAAVASLGAYSVVVWAMTQAPIALVGALRETSILFAMLIGWRIFGERIGPDKALAGGLILAGVALMRVAA